MVTRKEFYIIFDTEQNKYLESVGSYFFYFDPDPWWAARYPVKEDAEKAIIKGGLQEICVIKKLSLGFEVQECNDTNTK